MVCMHDGEHNGTNNNMIIYEKKIKVPNPLDVAKHVKPKQPVIISGLLLYI